MSKKQGDGLTIGELLGLVPFGIGAVVSVLVVQMMLLGTGSGPAGEAAEAIGSSVGRVPALLFSIGLMVLGVQRFFGVEVRNFGMHVFGVVGSSMGLAVLLGALSPTAGGTLGDVTGGFISRSLTTIPGVLFGVAAFALPIWLAWMRDSGLFPTSGKPQPEIALRTEEGRSGVSAAEAEALLPDSSEEQQVPAVQTADPEAPTLETPTLEAPTLEEAAEALEERPTWALQSEAVDPYPEDVRRRGEIPAGATPLIDPNERFEERDAQQDEYLHRWTPEPAGAAQEPADADLAAAQAGGLEGDLAEELGEPQALELDGGARVGEEQLVESAELSEPLELGDPAQALSEADVAEVNPALTELLANETVASPSEPLVLPEEAEAKVGLKIIRPATATPPRPSWETEEELAAEEAEALETEGVAEALPAEELISEEDEPESIEEVVAEDDDEEEWEYEEVEDDEDSASTDEDWEYEEEDEEEEQSVEQEAALTEATEEAEVEEPEAELEEEGEFEEGEEEYEYVEVSEADEADEDEAEDDDLEEAELTEEEEAPVAVAAELEEEGLAEEDLVEAEAAEDEEDLADDEEYEYVEVAEEGEEEEAEETEVEEAEPLVAAEASEEDSEEDEELADDEEWEYEYVEVDEYEEEDEEEDEAEDAEQPQLAADEELEEEASEEDEAELADDEDEEAEIEAVEVEEAQESEPTTAELEEVVALEEEQPVEPEPEVLEAAPSDEPEASDATEESDSSEINEVQMDLFADPEEPAPEPEVAEAEPEAEVEATAEAEVLEGQPSEASEPTEEPALPSEGVSGAEEESVVVLQPQAPSVAASALARSAAELILGEERVAVSMLQRKFDMDFKESCVVLDELQELGFIGPFVNGKARDILMSREEWLSAVGQS